jgi:carbonic anhydrase/acetyltransferase-like protein (isoleucine patch superfamily)
LRQRLQFFFGAEDTCLILDPNLEELYAQRHPDWLLNQVPEGPKLYLNSRIRVDESSLTEIRALQDGYALVNQQDIIAIRSDQDIAFAQALPESVKAIPCKIELYRQAADLIHDNARLIRLDFENVFYEADNYFETEPGVTVLHPYNIWIAENVSFAPNVVLDASDGPIVIDEGVKVMANSVITGPAYIGKKSIVKVAAKIYGGVSIGPVCKVGGEVEGSIFQAYSNKQHDGFLGHAFVGEWVNIQLPCTKPDRQRLPVHGLRTGRSCKDRNQLQPEHRFGGWHRFKHIWRQTVQQFCARLFLGRCR